MARADTSAAIFRGSNIDYCKKHHISVKMFYKKRVQFAANALTVNAPERATEAASMSSHIESTETLLSSPRFIPVLPAASPLPESAPTNSMQTHFTYDTRTGVLTLLPQYRCLMWFCFYKG